MKTRAQKQRGWLFGVAYPKFIPVFQKLPDYDGVKTPEDVHAILCSIRRVDGISGMDDDARSEHMAWVAWFGKARFKLDIPEPGEEPSYFNDYLLATRDEELKATIVNKG